MQFHFPYLQVGGLIVELSSDVDVSSTRSHGPTSDQAAFHQLVWIIPHDLSVLAGARLSLICVYYQILWPKHKQELSFAKGNNWFTSSAAIYSVLIYSEYTG